MSPTVAKKQPTKSAAPETDGEAPQTPGVVYDKVSVKLYQGDKSLTAVQARKLLGWQEETDQVKFGSDFLIKDENNVKVRCKNNVHNRRLREAWMRAIAQDILNGHWRLNGETVIIGKTGQVLSAQHRLIALVLADQIWAKHTSEKWDKQWPTAPTIETIVVYGIDETDETTRTLDNVCPRDLSDVLFVGGMFEKAKQRDRDVLCRMTSYAVKLLWHRTGAELDAFAPKRTHSESLDFIERHPRLLKCVQHIWEENTAGGVTKYMSPGYAAAMMYLMGCAAVEDPDKYRTTQPPAEKLLSWAMWDKASDFWAELAAGAKSMQSVRDAFAALLDGGTANERLAILIKAWHCYADGKEPTAAALKLKYRMSEDGENELLDRPTVGGIDLGDPSSVEDDAEADPTPDEIEERAKAIRKENGHAPADDEADAAAKPKRSPPKPRPKPVPVADEAPAPATFMGG